MRASHAHFLRTLRNRALSFEVTGSNGSDVRHRSAGSVLAEKFAVSQVGVGECAVVVYGSIEKFFMCGMPMIIILRTFVLKIAHPP